jgi:hypothetical protein
LALSEDSVSLAASLGLLALSRASAPSHFLRFSLISGVAASANISLITLQQVITVSANDAILAYLVSLGILGTGVIWIVASKNSTTSVFWIALGVLTVCVGLISLLTELRNRRH